MANTVRVLSARVTEAIHAAIAADIEGQGEPNYDLLLLPSLLLLAGDPGTLFRHKFFKNFLPPITDAPALNNSKPLFAGAN